MKLPLLVCSSPKRTEFPIVSLESGNWSFHSDTKDTEWIIILGGNPIAGKDGITTELKTTTKATVKITRAGTEDSINIWTKKLNENQ